MTTIGTIGAGKIGSAFARLAQNAGVDITLSNSRGADSLRDLASSIGEHVTAGDTADAVRADVIVLTIPLRAVTALPSDLLDGKVVIDTSNYYPQRDGAITDLDENRTTTAELVQAHFPGARIVKAGNNIFSGHLETLGRPAGGERAVLAIASDDADATAVVTALLDDLGYDVLNTGALADSWRFERDRPAYGIPYVANPEDLATFVPGQSTPIAGRLASATDLATALAAATR